MYILNAKFNFVYLLCQYDIIFLIYPPHHRPAKLGSGAEPKGEIVGYVQGDGF
jgi:hypothetical protein